MKNTEFDFDAARRDPAKFFADPADVVAAPDISVEQKLEILRQWEIDARLLSVAEEEAMAGSGASKLDRVLKALEALDPKGSSEETVGSAGASKLGT